MKQEEIDKMFEGRWRIKGFDDYEVRQLSGKAVKGICRDFFEAGIMLADKGCVANPHAKHLIELRSESFRQQVFSAENLALYPQEMLSEFFDYWSEPNRSQTKLRYESEKTWDLSRRLKRWAKNDYSGYVRKQQSSQQQLDKLADILST